MRRSAKLQSLAEKNPNCGGPTITEFSASLVTACTTSQMVSFSPPTLKTVCPSLSHPQTVSEGEHIFHCESSESVRHLHDRQFYLYNRALLFDLVSVMRFSFQGDVHAYSSVIIFNLALLYHRNALRGNTKCIDRAIPLYSMILKLLAHDCSNCLTAIIVKLAAINNLAQLYCLAGCRRKAQSYVSILSASIQRSRQSFPSFFRDDVHLKGLLLNLTRMHAQPTAPAA